MYQRSKKTWVTGIVFICVLCWGGFFDFAAIAMGAVFEILLLIRIQRRKELLLPKGWVLYAGLIFSISALGAMITAFDKGTAWIGILRIVSVWCFGLLWMNASDEEQRETFEAIPLSGAVLNLVSITAWFIPGLKDRFFSAGRLWGTMQYANTWALFLLIGLIILLGKEKTGRDEWIQAGILLLGIIMTGSRSVFVLTIIFGGWLFLRSKADKKVKALAVGIVIAAAAVIQLMMGLDLGRLADISLNSSTLNGRLLYWQDALKLITGHPMGVGYLNYYFMQPQIQTGYYFTKNVHNDLLQFMLDDGVIAAVVIVIFVGYGLYSKKNDSSHKLVLLVLALHSLFDFNLEFMVMTGILVMCMPAAEQKKVTVKMSAGVAAAGCLCLYFAAALGADYFGNTNLSLAMYPYNTMASQKLLSSEDKTVAVKAAERIVRENGMMAEAYETLLQQAVENKDYERAVSLENDMLKCAGYNLYYYNQAVLMLSHGLDSAVRCGDLDNGQAILSEIQSIPDKLEQLKERTTERAWKLYDQPTFDLDENIQNYIQEMESIRLHIEE